MKKKIIAALVAAAVTCACVPLISGCSVDVNYNLKTDGDGNQYYSVKCSGYTSSLKGEYEIPSEYNDLPVKEIESEAFANTSITKITIPATITKVGSMAFGYIRTLTEVVFEEGCQLNYLSPAMFCGCVNLGSIEVPSSIINIWHSAFMDCSRLESVTLHAGLDYIGNSAFESCTNIREIVLPDTLSNIGYQAFYLSGLKSIVIPDSVHDTFEESVNEKGETVKTEIPAIGYAAFHSCTDLKLAVLGSGITKILSGTFGYCTSLETVYLPASLKKVEGALYHDGNVYYAHPFHNNTSLKDVYYEGTEAEWQELCKNIDSGRVTESGAVVDNSAILNITPKYGQTYNP